MIILFLKLLVKAIEITKGQKMIEASDTSSLILVEVNNNISVSFKGSEISDRIDRPYLVKIIHKKGDNYFIKFKSGNYLCTNWLNNRPKMCKKKKSRNTSWTIKEKDNVYTISRKGKCLGKKKSKKKKNEYKLVIQSCNKKLELWNIRNITPDKNDNLEDSDEKNLGDGDGTLLQKLKDLQSFASEANKQKKNDRKFFGIKDSYDDEKSKRKKEKNANIFTFPEGSEQQKDIMIHDAAGIVYKGHLSCPSPLADPKKNAFFNFYDFIKKRIPISNMTYTNTDHLCGMAKPSIINGIDDGDDEMERYRKNILLRNVK